MRPPRRVRRLSDDEIALWRAVAETIEPRPGSLLPTLPPAPPSAPEPAVSAMVVVRSAATDPPQAKKLKPKSPPPLAPIERRLKQRIARGRVDIDRVIDLHGLTQAQAHGALRGFLWSAQRDDARLVLVVTGKGERTTARLDGHDHGGVLRRAVPQWLRDADLRTIVLGFEEATRTHGGMGALYVRLRRGHVRPS